MDLCQKRVLRVKRPVITAMVTFSPQTQKKLYNHQLLTNASLKQILDESTESGQMYKFLEVLQVRGEADSFDRLCHFLDSEGLSWISDELQSDLVAERGDLIIEDYIAREASMIVHRKFGTSKRIAEIDKREITELLAQRAQASKEAWRRQLDKVRGDLNETSYLKENEGEMVRLLLEKIEDFMHVQKIKINIHNHTTLSTSDDPTRERRTTTERNLKRLDTRQSELLEALSRVILERDKLEEEKKKCMTLLKVDKKCVHLDQAVANALMEAAEELKRLRMMKRESDELALSLENKIKQLTINHAKEIANKDRHILHLENIMREREHEFSEFDKQMYELKRQLDEAKEDIELWKARCEALEKTRRLGYLYGEGKVGTYVLNRLEKDRMTILQPFTANMIRPSKSSMNVSRVSPRTPRISAENTKKTALTSSAPSGQKSASRILQPDKSKQRMLKNQQSF